MKTETIRRWQDFVELSGELDGWVFRGQKNAQWLLQSSLSRYLEAYVPDKNEWPQREARGIRIFRRKAHNHLPDPSLLDDDLRCLGLMQHHGAPTRLLDFTKSPFVAAFFALERAEGDAAIFALNTPAIWGSSLGPKNAPGLTRSEIDPRVKGNLDSYFFRNTNEIVWCGEPSSMDTRLIAQSGTFVVPGVIDRSVEQILDGYNDSTHAQSGEPVEILRKIIVPSSLRSDAMRWLYRMNITNASLIPDLDGLARSVALELEISWPSTPLRT